MLIVAISPHQTLIGLAETMWHANTPHSDERHLMCLPLTLELAIGETMFRRATGKEYERWQRLFGGK